MAKALSLNPSLLLVGPYPLDRFGSIERFAQCLHRELSREMSVRVVSPDPVLGRLAPAPLTKWFGYLDKFVLFPRRLKQLTSADEVVHLCDQSAAIYTRCLRTNPHLITCNDLTAIRAAAGEFPAHSPGWSGRQLQKQILGGLRRARRIACVSSATRDDLLRLTSISEAKVNLVPMGLHKPFKRVASPAAIIQRYAPDQPFILHVGGNQWYKNRRVILDSYRALLRAQPSAPNLILLGEPSLIPSDLAGRVFSVVNCPDSDLPAFHSAARCLLFPSLAEGFGWPILEAQSCGCPVITSNRPPMTDVGGDSVVCVDPENPAGIASALAHFLNEPASITMDRTERGLQNTSRFSTASMIQNYREIYSSLTATAVHTSPLPRPLAKCDCSI